MEFFNQGIVRLRELIAGLGPGARLVGTVAVVGLIAAAVWGWGRQIAVPTETYLMNGQTFSAAQLCEIEAALGKAGLTEYDVDRMRVRVPHGQQARYMAALAEARALPANFGDHLKAAVEQNGFLLSGSRQAAQLKVAMQQELQAVINQFQGIESSSVQIAEEAAQGFPRARSITASVSVRPAVGQPLDERTASAIRCIVAQSWGGLKPESVTVVDLHSRRLFTGPLNNEPTAGDYAELKRQFEHDWQEKIGRLVGIPGTVVTANVELASDGRAPRAVSVAVSVPSEHFSRIWGERHAAAGRARPVAPDAAQFSELERAEHERIKQAIVPLLLSTGDESDGSSLVSVSTLYAAPTVNGGSPYERLAIEWLVANWQNLVLGGLVIVAVFLIRSTFRGLRPASAASSESIQIAQSLSLVMEDDLPAAEPSVASPAGYSQHEELIRQIRRDPEAAASVLKNWIGNAS